MSTTWQADDPATTEAVEEWCRVAVGRPWRNVIVWRTVGPDRLAVLCTRGRIWNAGLSVSLGIMSGALAWLMIQALGRLNVVESIIAAVGFLAALAHQVFLALRPRYGEGTGREQVMIDLTDPTDLPQARALLRRAHARIAREPANYAIVGRQMPREVHELLFAQATALRLEDTSTRHPVDDEGQQVRQGLHTLLREITALQDGQIATINRWVTT